MRIEPYERGRFTVFCHGEQFTVDVLVFRQAGFCSCFHYLKHLRAENEANHRHPDWRPTDINRCPHIIACRAWLTDLFLERLAQMYPDNELEP